MKKNTNIFILSLLCMFFTACGLEPQYSENPQLLKHIASDCLRRGLKTDYSGEVHLVFGRSNQEKIAEVISTPKERANNYNSLGADEWCENHWERFMTIKVIDHVLDEQMLGNTYTGYYVTYIVNMAPPASDYYKGLPYYYLVELTEFDDEHWEAQIVDKSNTLSKIKSNLY